MAGGAGRPMAALIPGGEERSFPERQARRRQVSHFLSERSRIILRCAEGVPNKVVAAELGGRPADGRQMVPPLREGPPRWAVGQPPVGTPPRPLGTTG